MLQKLSWAFKEYVAAPQISRVRGGLGRTSEMLPSQQERREEDHRRAIAEILFFASVGNVPKMRALCEASNVIVSAGSVAPAKPPSPTFHSESVRNNTFVSLRPCEADVHACTYLRLNNDYLKSELLLPRSLTPPAATMTNGRLCESLASPLTP